MEVSTGFIEPIKVQKHTDVLTVLADLSVNQEQVLYLKCISPMLMSC